jgi:eukaryotic-like serine/threonine-protein kinase
VRSFGSAGSGTGVGLQGAPSQVSVVTAAAHASPRRPTRLIFQSVTENPLPALQAHLGGRYRIHREVGHGSMARVYLADDLVRGGQVAIKALRPELAASLGQDRFLREIRILGRLHHPNILPLLDFSGGGSLYYVLPYIPGSSLQRRLEKEGSLPWDVVVRIARDVAAALDHAHASEVIHRDVKPGNILLGEDRALVCDFGIARAVELAGGDRLASSAGFALGTPAYMSPEQAIGSTIDARCDVYGLGCVLYEMMTGEQPFTGATSQAVLARSLAGDFRPVRTARPDAPLAAEAAIRAALASAPEQRPETAGELVARFTETSRS